MKKKRTTSSPKRCACGLVRVPGQRCLHGAEPGLDRISQRDAEVEAKRKQERARIEHERIGLGGAIGITKLNKAMAKFDPVTAWHRMSIRGAAKGRR